MIQLPAIFQTRFNLSNGNAAKFRNENLGFIAQHFALIQDMTVKQNIALPMIYRRFTTKQIKQRTQELLEMMELTDKLNKYPFELSGGQCQRVAIARAIAVKPKLLLADEPTGAIDEATGAKIMNILKRLNDDGMTILLFTHDNDIAKMCKREIHMRDGMICSH